MSATLTSCPERAVLVNFLVGQLPDDEVALLERHLSQCATCGDTVRGLHVEDTLLGLVRSAGEVAAQNEVPEEVVAKLRRLRVSEEDAAADGCPAGSSVEERAEEVLRLLDPAQQEDEIGRLGSYRVLKLLGAGGMGVVFHAKDEQLQRLVALKVLRPSLGAAARARFLREARAAAAIDHENVITIYQVGEDGPLAFLAMQWLDGETLEDRLKREGKLPAEQTLAIGKQIAQGLAAAHARKLIHRDVKPANIWLEADRKRVKILDFGLAFVYDEETQLTETGMIGGTPAYMSPEQAGGERIDARSDLFSLGTVLYRMCTTALPFPALNVLAMLRAVQHDSPAPLEQSSEAPQPLASLVMHLLEKEPPKRLQSAPAVVEAIERIERGEGHIHQPRRIRVRQVIGCAIVVLGALLASAFAPQVIRIATNQGQLVIKTDDPNVQLEIRGETVRIIDLRTKRTLDLKAGSYEIKLVEGAEGLTLSTANFTLTRGGKVIVEVLRELAAPAEPRGALTSDTASGEPQFDGKTFRQWLAELDTERKHERVAEAVRALAALVNDERAPETIAVIFRLMRKFGSNVNDGSPRAKLIGAAHSALWQMPRDVAVTAMIEELKHGNENSRRFLELALMYPDEGNPFVGEEEQSRQKLDFQAAIKKRSKEIASLVLGLSRSDSLRTRSWAVNYLAQLCLTLKIDPASVEGLVPRLQEELQSKDPDRTFAVAPLLINAAPDSEGLGPALVDALSKETWHRYSAVHFLGQLGPKAALAVKPLAKLLEDLEAGKAGSASLGFGGDLRVKIMEALGSIGPAAKEALPILEKFARGANEGGPSPEFQKAAIAAISKIRLESNRDK